MKGLCILLSLIVLLGGAIPVKAAEKGEIDSSMSNEEGQWINASIKEMKVGDTKIIYQDAENILSVTLTSIETEEKITKAGKLETERALYEFKENNLLGVSELQFEVGVVCRWLNDGANSKITDFYCEYTNYQENKYRLQWDNKNKVTTDITCTWWLDVIKNVADVKSVAFSAWCHCIGTDAAAPYISFDCY